MTASQSGTFTVDAPVRCLDDECGIVNRLIIDPEGRLLTHLVVRATHGLDRLVPISLVGTVGPTIQLSCTHAEFESLEEAQHVLEGGIGVGMSLQSSTIDTAPLDQVAVAEGEHIEATDGRIGRVEGLVVDLSDHRLTDVLLSAGHLWGSRKVAIPIDAVATFDPDSVKLKLSRDAVRDLLEVDDRKE